MPARRAVVSDPTWWILLDSPSLRDPHPRADRHVRSTRGCRSCSHGTSPKCEDQRLLDVQSPTPAQRPCDRGGDLPGRSRQGDARKRGEELSRRSGEAPASQAQPASMRRGSYMFCFADPCASRRLRAIIAVLCQRDGDGPSVKVLEGKHALGSDDADSTTLQTAKPPKGEHLKRRDGGGCDRTADLALESAVTDERQAMTDGRGRSTATRAMRRASEVDRGRVRNPGLEVEGRMNKNGETSGNRTIRWGL
jgi:hypothetical protein